jgi:hypothetical protein
MIELGNQTDIDQTRSNQRTQISNQFASQGEVTAITKEDFEKSYPSETFERYSTSSVKKFVDDFKKSDDAENEEVLASNLKGLKKVVVSDGELIADVYVREIEEEV